MKCYTASKMAQWKILFAIAAPTVFQKSIRTEKCRSTLKIILDNG